MESLIAGYERTVDYSLDCSNCRLLSCCMSCCEGGRKWQVELSAYESVRYKGEFQLCQNLWPIYFSLDYIYCAGLHSQAVLNIERKTEQVKFVDTADQLTSHLISPNNINNITWRRCSFLLYRYFFTCKLWSKLEWVKTHQRQESSLVPRPIRSVRTPTETVRTPSSCILLLRRFVFLIVKASAKREWLVMNRKGPSRERCLGTR